MSIPPRFVEELRDRVTLSEIVGRRVKLTRSNREFKGCCPFHHEKTPSFYVNDEKQFFHCFGCGAHGDAVGFVMRNDNLSFVEAVEALASQAGMQVPKQSPQEIEKAKIEKSLHSLLEETCQWFEARLREGKNREVLEYLTKRGLSEETISGFRLGYAPENDQELRKFLKAKGYTDAQMIEASVLRPSQRGGDPYGFFRDRVMFPVADMRGRIVAFSGRVLPEHIRPLKDPTKKPPKYINSTDTPLFHKGRMLYAQQHARQSANDHPLVVVEGQMDVIACHQAGVKGAVAPLGTALTEEQISVLWKMIPHERKEPVLCFDGDNAGYRAAVRAADRILPMLKANQSVKIAFLPEGEDPDTFISSRGLDAFTAKLNNSLTLIDFLWAHHTASQDFSSPEMRAGLSALLDGLAAKIQDAQVQYFYKQAFRDKTRSLFSNFQPRANQGAARPGGFNKKPASVTVSLPPIRKQQDMVPQIVLSAMLNHPFLYAHFADHILQLHPEDAEISRLFQEMLDFMSGADTETLDKQALSGHLSGVGLADIAMKLTHERVYLHAGFCRPDANPEIALQGLKDLWENWEKSRLAEDIKAARAVFRLSMTPENESRMFALQHLQLDSETGTD